MNSILDSLPERQRRCVPDVSFELVPISNLVSNQEYQRAISETHVRKTVQEFDVNQLNPVKVSRRDGQLFVVNGQHTIEIVAHESGSRSTPIWCMIYDNMQYDEEAHEFATQQRHVRQLTAYEIYKAHIEAGDAKQLLLKSIAESNGLTISGKKVAQNYITAIGTLENIYDKYGQEVLNRTLRLAVATWEGRAGSLSGTILSAIARIVAAYDEVLEDELFVEGVSELSAKTILRDAKDKRPGSIGVAYVMIEQYNKKARKNQLDKAGLFGGRRLIRGEPKKQKTKNNETSEAKKSAQVAANEKNEAAPPVTVDTAPASATVEGQKDDSSVTVDQTGISKGESQRASEGASETLDNIVFERELTQTLEGQREIQPAGGQVEDTWAMMVKDAIGSAEPAAIADDTE